ncbi:hypothetical protein LA5095_01956 [Roseibium album]|uniref:Uncharacterized protein n=1 Tax=Roseibium album TaxID=311410 RepID=A0A0M7A648_9HYPH|nr:hypothetical protein LA5094_00901 [Roseibium album]CTQ65676.1 hypothetical protein LA5096_00812 [Roseibium album]CTQ70558.1 hypothetical protein LA5095_01956 [Roseibium album]
MALDITSLPVSGGVLASGLVFAGLSAFVLGPLVAERTAQKIGWYQDCEREIVQDLHSHTSDPVQQPAISCKDMFGHMPGEHRQVLNLFGMGAACAALDQTLEQKRRLETLRQQRLERAADEAGARCSCAVAHLVETERVSLALFVSSARLITPPSLTDFRASLKSSAESPICRRLASVED